MTAPLTDIAREQRDPFGAVEVRGAHDISTVFAVLRTWLAWGEISSFTIEQLLDAWGRARQTAPIGEIARREGVLPAAITLAEERGLVELVGEVEDYRGEAVEVWRVL